jgi:hypothetical protein
MCIDGVSDKAGVTNEAKFIRYVVHKTTTTKTKNNNKNNNKKQKQKQYKQQKSNNKNDIVMT